MVPVGISRRERFASVMRSDVAIRRAKGAIGMDGYGPAQSSSSVAGSRASDHPHFIARIYTPESGITSGRSYLLRVARSFNCSRGCKLWRPGLRAQAITHARPIVYFAGYWIIGLPEAGYCVSTTSRRRGIVDGLSADGS